MKSFFDLRQQNIEESSYTPKAQVGPVETDNAVDTPDINIGNLSTESLQQFCQQFQYRAQLECI